MYGQRYELYEPENAKLILRILEDGCSPRARYAWKYSVAAVIDRVVCSRVSVASCSTQVPSYLWAQCIVDGGEISVDVDTGLMPFMVRDLHKKNRARINLAAYEMSEGLGLERMLPDGADENGLISAEQWMFVQGLALYQPFLLRVHIDWWTDDYSGETDCEVASELVHRVKGETETLVAPVFVERPVFVKRKIT